MTESPGAALARQVSSRPPPSPRQHRRRRQSVTYRTDRLLAYWPIALLQKNTYISGNVTTQSPDAVAFFE